MREAAFVRKNKENWLRFEQVKTADSRISPDELADLFVRVTDDLAYARTYYPGSSTELYLNRLAGLLHVKLYRNKKEKRSRLITFWRDELPEVLSRSQYFLLVAFCIFAASALIGSISTIQDENFPRLILGDDYVNMTLENIEKGDPMAVYKDSDGSGMFFRITFNNIRVSFLAFAGGIFTSIMTVFIMFQNGVMLGAFQTFFYNQNLLAESFLTIWIHGTLEISAIVIAGAAGLSLGSGFLFPGSYPRLDAFRYGAKRGMKIVTGLIPVFIAAGFLESFATRHTEFPDGIKLLIISLSALFILTYFVFWPLQIRRKRQEKTTAG